MNKQGFNLPAKLIRSLHLLEDNILRWGIFLIATAIVTQTIFRYFFPVSLRGLEEASLTVVCWVYFVGIAIASRERRQINVSILELIPLSNSTRKYLDVIATFIALATCVLFLWLTIKYMCNIHARNVLLAPWGISYLVIALSMPTGFLLSSYYTLTEFIEKCRRK
jgi:TRAP-type C4-dicarboxylate transport system permease small subunit